MIPCWNRCIPKLLQIKNGIKLSIAPIFKYDKYVDGYSLAKLSIVPQTKLLFFTPKKMNEPNTGNNIPKISP